MGVYADHGQAADNEIAGLRVDLTQALLTAAELQQDVAARDLTIAALHQRIADLEDEQPDPDPQTFESPVRIGAASFPLAGVNGYRNTNELRVYKDALNTGCNEYGDEAQVVDGQVVAYFPRLQQGSTAPTLIPENGYVLSGHGTAQQWLANNAHVGATVMFGSGTTPDPVETDKVMAMWYHRWAGPSIRDWPDFGINQISLGIAQSAGNGAVSYAPNNGQSVQDHAADIAACEARGCRVLLGFGGAGDTTTITNAQQATNFVNSVVALQATYGFSGVDIDLEPSGTSWSEQYLVSAMQQLKALFGAEFLVGITPGLYGTHTARWLSLANALGTGYDFMAPMLYDFPEATDSRLTAVTLDKIQIMLNGGVPTNKMIMGYMPQPSPGYPASPVQVAVNAFTAAKGQHPDLKGVFIWASNHEADSGWAMTQALSPIALGGL